MLVVVLDAAVVSTALLSFLLQAARLKAATASAATLSLDTTIVPPHPIVKKKTAPNRYGTGRLAADQGKNRTHGHITRLLTYLAATDPDPSW
jgi:hypothetical protein